MKKYFTAKLSLIVASVLLFWTSWGQAQALNETLYDTAPPVTWRDSYSGGEGCQFTVGPTNVVVSHLGYFSSNSITGLNATHYVGIYSVSPSVQLLVEVQVPAGTAADSYTNQYYWMPLDPPFLLQSNTQYAVMAQQFSGDGDLWGDAFYTTFNPFFLGQTTNNPLLAPQAVFGPGNGQWPVPGYGFWSASGSNSTYQVEGLANLPIDHARVGVQSTNIVASPGPLSVVGFATGQTPITYQWWQPGSPPTQVAGQTGPNLTFANASPANSGIYFLTASNVLGGEQSADVFISVVANPVGLEAGATNAAIFNNYPATFTVVVTGSPPVTIQWFSNSIPDPNSITTYGSGSVFTNSYSVIAQTPDSGNIYTMVASNNIVSVAHMVTNSATLTVVPNFGYPEHILHPPPGTNIFYASSPGTTHGNNGNGGSGGDIVIGNNNVLITHLGFCAVGLPLNGIPALEADHHIEIFSYPGLALQGYVVVTNGTPASSAYNGYLWVALNPPLLLSNSTTYVICAENLLNEDYWGDTYIPSGWDSFITPGGSGNNAVYGGGFGNTWPTPPNSGHYGSQIYSGPNMGDLVVSNQIFALSTPNNQTVAAGSSITLTGYVNGPPPVTVQWYQNGVAMPGQTNIILTVNNVPPGSSTYTLLATNVQTGIGTFSGVSTVIAFSSPVIISATPETYTNSGPTNLMTVYTGASPIFSLNALGAGTLAYQWYTNGAAVAGATNASYEVSNIKANIVNGNNISCIVTNLNGSATNLWSATVVPAPTNSIGGPAPYPQSVLSLNPVGYWRLNEPDCCGGQTGPNDGSIATDYAGGNNGLYTNMSLGWPGYNPLNDPSDTSAQFGEVDEVQGDFGDSYAGQIAGVNFAAPSGTSVAFSVEAWVAGYASPTYDAGIVTLGWGNGGEQFDLDEGNDTAPASHAFRFVMRDAGGATHLVGSLLEPSGIATWYHLVAVVDEISNTTVSLYTNGVLCGTAAIAHGAGVLNSTNPVLGMNSLMSIGSRMAAEVGNFNDQFYGNINDVSVFNYALSAQQVYNQYLEGATIPPYLNPAPSATYIMSANLPATIAAIASGPPPLGYQWIDTGHGNAVLQSGVTNGTILNASFVTSSASPSLNNDTLELVVTNGFGSTNVSVLITVATAPQIATNLPPQVIVGQGQSYSYIVGAAGDTNLVYQWFENSSKVPGATNVSYNPSTTIGSTNAFDVVVTNGYGSVTSTISTFMVVSLPHTTLASAISGLQPVGYWPMHEVEPAAPGDTETNYGTLGVLGQGYYPDWVANYGQFLHNIPGAIVSDSDTAMFFNQNFFAGGSYTNGLYIPNTVRAATLNPPFTVECWIMQQTNNAVQNTVWGQTAFEGLNAGGENGGGSANGIGPCGIRLYWNATAPSGIHTNSYTIYTYDNSSTLNAIITMTNNVGINTDVWCHVVVTCDANTNFSLYTNGALVATAPAVGKYSPDYWNPLTIGTSKGFSQALACGVDEFAVYTNALSAATILNDYQAGVNPSPATSYFQTISNNQPVIYYRMNSPTYNAPSPSTWPTMYNYGSVLGNGVYTPGTVTGVLPGPNTLYTGETNQGANVAVLSGVSSFGDAGYNPTWDPSSLYGTASNAFSVTCMFRGNPADNRYQTIFGHHDGTWKVDLTANNAGSGGVPGSVLWAGGSGSVNSTNSLNDGMWHQIVGTYTPGPLASPGTLRLYVDGQFNNFNANVSSNGITTAAPAFDILMGAVPDYTNNPAGPGRQFDGELCDVAIFTNVLTPAQVQSLYNAAGGLAQPLSLPISGQLPVTWNYVGPNLGNNMGPTNLMNLYAGASPSFLVTAYGAPGGSYQWFTNGVAVGFGTNNILTLPNVQKAFTAYCIATNSINSVTSVVWSASIVADPDPAGSFSQTIMSDNPTAYWRLNETHGSTVAIDYAGGANGQYGAQTTNGLPGVPFVSATPELAVAMNPNASGNASGSVTNLGVVMVTNTCTFVVWELPTTGEGSYYGAFVNRSTANFSGAGLSGTPTWGAYWNNASQTYGLNSGLGVPAVNTWFMGVVEIFPQYDVLATFTNSTAGYVLSSYVTNSTIPDPVESFLGGNEIGCDNGTALTRIFHGELNELAIFNYDLSPAQLNALVNASTNGALTTATIYSQPQSAAVSPGATTNFAVTAGSFVMPLTYHWYFNTANSYSGATLLANGLQANGSWLTNATTAQLTITNVTAGALGYYFAAVGNTAGTVNSAIAALTTGGTASNPTNIVFSVQGNTNLVLSWPANHTGWQLQAQTNRLTVGISTNWVNVSGSTGTNQVIVPINLTNGSVFYRLVY